MRFLQLFEGDKKRGCVMAPIEGELQKLLISFAKSIPDDDIYKPNTSDESDGYGRDLEPHVTALFGLLSGCPKKLQPALSKFSKIKMTLGKTSLFKNKDFHVLKFDIVSPDLVKLNGELTKLEHENDHPDYHPHCTVAYLKADDAISGKYTGVRNFEDQEATAKSVIFSYGYDERTRIPL